MTNSDMVQEYLDKYSGASKSELRAILKTLEKKNKTTAVQSEILAIKTLLI